MDNEVDDILNEYAQEQKKELDDVLAKIDAGERTTINYLEAYMCYYYMQEKNEYQAELEKYAELVMQIAREDIERNRDVASAYSSMAYIYKYSKNYEQAMYCINKAIELEPENADYYLVRGNFYKDIKKNSLAEADFAKAQELNPSLKETIEISKRADKLIKESRRINVLFYILMGVVAIYVIYFVYELIVKLINL